MNLTYGAHVHCPADRGDKAYTGTVRHVDGTVNKNIHGVPYVWVTVQRIPDRSRHVWPSHRLGFTINLE
jgi:hypothetical protein